MILPVNNVLTRGRLRGSLSGGSFAAAPLLCVFCVGRGRSFGRKAAHDSLGDAYMQADQPEKAIVQFQASLGLDGEGTMYYQMAQAHQKAGQKELADQTMQKSREDSKVAN